MTVPCRNTPHVLLNQKMDPRVLKVLAGISMKSKCAMLFVVLLLNGCGTPPVKQGVPHTADEQLIHHNRMADIAVVAESQVWWRMVARDEPVLGLQISKQAMTELLPAIQKELEKKGYQVSFVQATGIGYANPMRKKNYVYKDYSAEGEDSFYQPMGHQPAYEYDIFKDRPQARLAAQNLFENLEAKGARFAPGLDDLRQLHAATGGDTICLARVGGLRYSDERRGVESFMAVLSVVAILGGGGGGGGHISEHNWTLFISCIEPATGKIIWQHGNYVWGDPIAPDLANVTAMLKYFPDAGQPMSRGCIKNDDNSNLYYCRLAADDGPWAGMMNCGPNSRGEAALHYKTRLNINKNTTNNYQFDLNDESAAELKWLHNIYPKQYFIDDHTLEFPVILEMDSEGNTTIKGSYVAYGKFFDISLQGEFKNNTFNLKGVRGTRTCQLELRKATN